MNISEISLYNKYGIVFYINSNRILSSNDLSIDDARLSGFDSEGLFKLEKLFITKNVKEVTWNGLGRFNFNIFDVDPANPIFQQFNGVLYTKKGYDRHGNTSKKRMIELVACPTNIESHNILNGTIRIANCAFKGSNITRLTLPNTLEEIGTNAFYYAKHLNSIEIPSSIRKIEPQKGSFIESIKYDNHIFQSWEELFSYMEGNGFEDKKNNIVKKLYQ